MRAIARSLAEPLGGRVLADLADEAATLAKADLLTDMVGEFPELQGIMGGYYARHDGEPEAVALALEDDDGCVGNLGCDPGSSPAATLLAITRRQGLLGRSALDLADPWAELEAQQVMRGTAFSHDLVHDAVLQGLPDAAAPVRPAILAGALGANGPRASMPIARAASIAGAISRSSSSPNRPPSPACGFSPATAMSVASSSG